LAKRQPVGDFPDGHRAVAQQLDDGQANGFGKSAEHGCIHDESPPNLQE
jgi:hypothetical protein